MQINTTVLQLNDAMTKKWPRLVPWLPMVRFLMATRENVEKAGIRCYCAFADSDRNVVLIKEDCETLDEETVVVILFHEIAHAIYPDWDEAKCDAFAALHTSPEALEKARKQTDELREQLLKSKVDWSSQFIFDDSDAMWENITKLSVGTKLRIPDSDDEVIATIVYSDPDAGVIVETRINGKTDTLEHYDTKCRLVTQVF